MKRSALVSLALVVGSVGSLVFAGACSSGGGGTTDGGTSSSSGGSGSSSGSTGMDAGTCPYSPDADLTTPSVSFASDVKPVFAKSCGIAGSTCHGTTMGMMGLFLGSFDGGTDPATIVNGIVNKPSTEDPQMQIVKAGDPDHSYLVHKMIGDQDTFDSDCAKGSAGLNPPCGVQMPFGNGCIDMTPATIDTVRRWIAQGAKNN